MRVLLFLWLTVWVQRQRGQKENAHFLQEFKWFKSNGMLLIHTGQVQCCMISSHVSADKYHPERKILTETKVKTSSSEIFSLKAFLSETGSNHRRVWFQPLFSSSPPSLRPHIPPRSPSTSLYLSACGNFPLPTTGKWQKRQENRMKKINLQKTQIGHFIFAIDVFFRSDVLPCKPQASVSEQESESEDQKRLFGFIIYDLLRFLTLVFKCAARHENNIHLDETSWSSRHSNRQLQRNKHVDDLKTTTTTGKKKVNLQTKKLCYIALSGTVKSLCSTAPGGWSNISRLTCVTWENCWLLKFYSGAQLHTLLSCRAAICHVPPQGGSVFAGFLLSTVYFFFFSDVDLNDLNQTAVCSIRPWCSSPVV